MRIEPEPVYTEILEYYANTAGWNLADYRNLNTESVQ